VRLLLILNWPEGHKHVFIVLSHSLSVQTIKAESPTIAARQCIWPSPRKTIHCRTHCTAVVWQAELHV